MSRFIDTKFDNKQLPPICGYWSENLVPLEQALKLIIPRVEQLDRSIKAARKYCRFPSEHGLTHDESAALYLYTMEGGENSFYRILNDALRSEDRPALKPWFPYLKLLDTAFSKLPTVRGKHLARCTWQYRYGFEEKPKFDLVDGDFLFIVSGYYQRLFSLCRNIDSFHD